MTFGDFILSVRRDKRLSFRTAGFLTKIDHGRLSQIEREVSQIPPSEDEIQAIRQVYGIERWDCEPYVFNLERFTSDEATLNLIKTKSKDELLAHGIFACCTGHDDN
jgi:transcriptional regulator with XRE-family HTH domain